MAAQQKDYFWNSTGTFLQSLISPALLIVITRWNGISASGVFSYALAFAVILWTFGLWGGRTYQVSDVKNEFSNSGYIMVRLITGAIIVVLAVLFCVLNSYDSLKSGMIISLVVFKAIESVADAVYGVLQRHERLYITGISLTIKAALGFAGFVLTDYVTGSMPLGVGAIILVNIVVVVLYDWPQARNREPRTMKLRSVVSHTVQAAQIMKRCLPVFVVFFMMMFPLNIPRYFLDKSHADQIGFFGLMAMPITLLALFISFIIQPNIVTLAKVYKKGDMKLFNSIFRKIIAATFAVGSVVLVVTYLLGVRVVSLLFGVDITAYKVDLLIMVTGAVAAACVTVYVNILTVMRKFKSQFYVLIITNMALIGLSAYFVKVYAMTGSVTLFALISALQMVLLEVIYNKHIYTTTVKR